MLLIFIFLFISKFITSHLFHSIVHTGSTEFIWMILPSFHLISLVIITFTMYLNTVKELQKWQDEAKHWKSQSTICHAANNGMDEVSIELCQAIGKVPTGSKQSPIKFPNQPPFPPKNSWYQFNLKKFKGEE